MKHCCSQLKILLCAMLFCVAQNLLAQSTNLPIQEISPGIFQLGSVRLDKVKKTVQFPATVNMTNGPVEYFVVTGTGKLHESIFKTEISPRQIHVAMLLLGATDGSTNRGSTNIFGDALGIEVSWNVGGKTNRLRAEQLVFNSETKTSMSKDGWIYNGSKIIDGTFIAERDGSIVSIIGDPLALVNSAQAKRDNDEIWFVKTNAVPPLHTKVDVTLQLEWPQKRTRDTK